MSKAWPKVRLGEVLKPTERGERVDVIEEYRLLGVRLDGQGPFLRETVLGTHTSATKLFRVATGDFIYSRLFACRGAFGVINEELDGCYVSGEFPTFVPVPGRVDVEFLKYWFRLPSVIATVDADCSGSTPLTRNRFKEHFFLALEIPLPPLAEQRRVVARIEELATQIHEARTLRHQAAEEAEALSASWLNSAFVSLAKKCARQLGDVTEIIGGGSLPDTSLVERNSSDVLLVKVSDMNRPGNEVFIRESAFGLASDSPLLRGFRVLPAQSIVFPKRGGAIATNKKRILKRPAVLDPNTMGVFPKRESGLCHEFLFKWLNNVDLASLQEGTSVPQINKSDLAPLQIPVPPLPDQRRIVAELDALQAEVDALKRLQAETAAELGTLLPAILDKAFKAEL
jgi:type I restriction enzyme S subunit